MVIVKLPVGAEGAIDCELVGGVLQFELDETTPGLNGKVQLNVPVTYFLDALAAKANSPIVTSIVGVVDGIVKGLP